MKRFFFVSLLLLVEIGHSQISNYNQFPTMKPQHVLDDKLTDISFAFSMRVLESDYNGPLVRLRRDSDNTERDFGWGDNDIVHIVAINAWKGTSGVFVHTWYDQSGLGRNAVQTIQDQQPQFYPVVFPYFEGDGVNDVLFVGSMAEVTENGKNAAIAGVFYATDRADSAFGVSGSDIRWLVHINWSNENVYFDPGYCCNNPRNFENQLPTYTINPGSLTKWDQYSFIRRDDPTNATTDRTIMRLGGVEKVNGDFPDNKAFSTTTIPFGLCATAVNTTGGAGGYSNTRFAEMIMYNKGKEDLFIQKIEENQIAFWEL